MYFSGHVINVVFDNPDESFYILKVRLDGSVLEEPVTIRGYVPGYPVKIGSWLGFEGDWATHFKYGSQIQISKAPVFKDGWGPETVANLLVAHGVGSFLVDGIRAATGDENFLATLADPDKLAQIPVLDGFSASYLHQKWQVIQTYFRSVVFLGDLGLRPAKIRLIWSIFGDRAETILSQNPWALVAVPGISFQAADAVAVRLGLSLQHEGRIQGAVQDILQGILASGHLYAKSGEIHGMLQKLLGDVSALATGAALAELHKAGKLVVDRETVPGVRAIYLPKALKIEQESANLLMQRLVEARYSKKNPAKPYIERLASVGPRTAEVAKKARVKLLTVIETALDEWGASAHLSLSDDQKQGIANALGEPVSVLTGLPGTGKTTSLQAAVRIFQEAGVKFLLCAPTGIAAKNLSARTGAVASTIHRALAAQGSSEDSRDSTYTGIVGSDPEGLTVDFEGDEFWGYSAEHPHPAEVVVVDEASMVDQHLLYRLLYSTSPQCRLVLVGDAAQLPSVGPGNVLRDMIRSGVFPVVNLTEIFRQKDTSDIVFAAHDIYRGQIPKTDLKSDFGLIRVARDETALDRILELVSKLYESRHKGSTPITFQVLSPRHAGTVGVTNLNARLRALLNPGSGAGEIRLGEDLIRENDRIMIIRNNYKYGVFNGDVGKVSRINVRDKRVELKIFGDPPLVIQVPFREVPRLIRLAYACTVHKCVKGDTLVHTGQGLIPIRDLATGDPGRTGGMLYPARHQVAGRCGWTHTKQVFVGGVEPTIRIETRMGFALEGSYRHPVLILTQEGQYIWKLLPDVVLGDAVVLRRGLGNNADLFSTTGFVPNWGRNRKGVIPDVVCKDMAWLLGVLVGDGNQTDLVDGRIDVAQRDQDFKVRVASVWESLFELPATVRRVSVYVHSRAIREFLAWCGLSYHKAPQKETPHVILRSPVEIQCAFLRGLFDTDGGVSRLIHLTTTSRKLAYEVQQMLLGVGILSSLVLLRGAVPEKGWAAAYRIQITGGRDALLFQERIGFSVARKQEALQQRVCRLTRSKSNVLALPCSRKWAVELRDALRKRGGRNYPEAGTIGPILSAAIRGVNPLRDSHLNVLSSDVLDLGSVHPGLSEVVSSGLIFDVVSKCEEGEAQVFDLYVEDDNHAFVGGGFVNHNSQGLEYDVIVMPLVLGFKHQLQRNLLYTAITRAKRKVILVGSAEALAAAVANDKEDLRNTLFPARLQKFLKAPPNRVDEPESVRRTAGRTT